MEVYPSLGLEIVRQKKLKKIAIFDPKAWLHVRTNDISNIAY